MNSAITRIAAVAMKKGGVGKTTTAVSLASLAVSSGYTVGLIDLDSQASATLASGVAPGDTAAELLLGHRALRDAWTPTEWGYDVIASGPGTEGAERQLATDPIDGLTALRRALSDSAHDLLIIDTRPDESHGVINALVAAHEVWAVVEPVPAAIDSLPRLMSTVTRIAGSLNPHLSVSAIIPTRFDRRTRTHQGCLEALRRIHGPLVTAAVPASVRAAEAHGARTPLPLYDPLAPASTAYREIARHLGILSGVTA